MQQTLSKVGGVFMIPVPEANADQNGLTEDSVVELEFHGRKLTVLASSPRSGGLANLLAEMPGSETLDGDWESKRPDGCS